MMNRLIAAFFATGLAAGSAFAAEDTAAAGENEEGLNLDTATCTDVFDLCADAPVLDR